MANKLKRLNRFVFFDHMFLTTYLIRYYKINNTSGARVVADVFSQSNIEFCVLKLARRETFKTLIIAVFVAFRCKIKRWTIRYAAFDFISGELTQMTQQQQQKLRGNFKTKSNWMVVITFYLLKCQNAFCLLAAEQ